MKVGFIGLGRMGVPMSGNVLAAGHDLLVHDVRPDAAAGLLAAGASWAGSPRDAAADRDVVITMLPGPSQVEDVLLGPGGLLAALPADAVWADMSTSVPAVADKFRASPGPGRRPRARWWTCRSRSRRPAGRRAARRGRAARLPRAAERAAW